ncbi:MAG: hypothetical protein P4L87_03005 [Formivibrio sp.]|nr:hypothetical protein [Formivibrio sp.]
MKPPSKHLRKQLSELLLFELEGDAPTDELGDQSGRPRCLRRPAQLVRPGLMETCLLRAKNALLCRWQALRPLVHAQHDLRAFSTGIARWLVAVHDIDSQDKSSVQLAENALIRLVMLQEDGPLLYCTNFTRLYSGYLTKQWAAISREAQHQIHEHAHWLLTGSNDGLVRPLLPRIEFRRVGFGCYEDYFRCMPREEYQQFLRGCQILAEQGSEALGILLRLQFGQDARELPIDNGFEAGLPITDKSRNSTATIENL